MVVKNKLDLDTFKNLKTENQIYFILALILAIVSIAGGLSVTTSSKSKSKSKSANMAPVIFGMVVGVGGAAGFGYLAYTIFTNPKNLKVCDPKFWKKDTTNIYKKPTDRDPDATAITLCEAQKRGQYDDAYTWFLASSNGESTYDIWYSTEDKAPVVCVTTSDGGGATLYTSTSKERKTTVTKSGGSACSSAPSPAAGGGGGSSSPPAGGGGGGGGTGTGTAGSSCSGNSDCSSPLVCNTGRCCPSGTYWSSACGACVSRTTGSSCCGSSAECETGAACAKTSASATTGVCCPSGQVLDDAGTGCSTGTNGAICTNNQRCAARNTCIPLVGDDRCCPDGYPWDYGINSCVNPTSLPVGATCSGPGMGSRTCQAGLACENSVCTDCTTKSPPQLFSASCGNSCVTGETGSCCGMTESVCKAPRVCRSGTCQFRTYTYRALDSRGQLDLIMRESDHTNLRYTIRFQSGGMFSYDPQTWNTSYIHLTFSNQGAGGGSKLFKISGYRSATYSSNTNLILGSTGLQNEARGQFVDINDQPEQPPSFFREVDTQILHVSVTTGTYTPEP